MTRNGLLIILLVALMVLPIGGVLCANEAMPAAPVDNCCRGCEPAAACECCCYEAEQQPADQPNAILPKVEPTAPRLFVLSEALPQPTIVADAAVALEPTITPHDFLFCLTRAERAPPA